MEVDDSNATATTSDRLQNDKDSEVHKSIKQEKPDKELDTDQKHPTSAHNDNHNHDGIEGGSGTSMPWYLPPRQRHRWTDQQSKPHTEWGDIFFDLFYVAAFYKLGNLLRSDPSPRGLLYLLGCFFPIVFFWVSKLIFAARFYVSANDIFHRLFEVANIVPLATAVLFIRTVPILSDPTNMDMFGFAISILAGSILAVARVLEVVVCQRFFKADGLYDEAYFGARRELISFLPAVLFASVATIYSGSKHFGTRDVTFDVVNQNASRRILGGTTDAYQSALDGALPAKESDVAIWLCLAAPLSNLALIAFNIFFVFRKGTVNHKKFTVPVNIDYCIHRWGEWIMLLLGESVLSLLIAQISQRTGYYKTFYAGVITVILLEFLHFRSQPHNPDDHALRRNLRAGFIFFVTMWVYSASLLVLGICYKMFMYEFVYEETGSVQHRSLFQMPRSLAAGGDLSQRYDKADQQQSIANFFSGSMAIVWFSLDVTILLHNGTVLKFDQGTTKATKFVGIMLVAMRVGLIVFMATLSQYLTDPSSLVFIGMAGVFVQISLRILEDFYVFPQDT